MMFKYCSIAMALLAGAASANPFAAKTTPSNAKAAYTAKLFKNAIPTENSQMRKLNEDEDIDLTAYSLKFEKCQFVKSYSQDLAEAGSDTVLATQRFVLFRLCPTGSCSSCNSNYGEYMVDMEDYLGYTVDYRQEEQEEMCNACDEQCYYEAAEEEAAGDDAAAAGDDAGGGGRRLYTANCDTCQSDCQKIANMEANYYLDATSFVKCQELKAADDDGAALYAGPICASQGAKIKIGVFTDEDCMFLDSSKDVENYLSDEDGNGMKLSHALLKTTYSSTDCISCVEDVDGDDDAAKAAAGNKEVCTELYESAAKCESKHGFTGLSSANQYYQSANQISNEELVCDFISSLKSGTYSQDGEIVIGGSKVYTAGGTSTSGGQKFALTFFIIGTVGLAVYAAMLHTQLTKGGKPDLSAQGGAMA
jgi:hypothetical protein